MKKIMIFIFTVLCLLGIIWGVGALSHLGGGFKENDVSAIKDTGHVRNWTKKEFNVLTPQDWDDGSDSQYSNIVKVFGPGDERRLESQDTSGSKKAEVKHLVITWRQKDANIYMGFYKYSPNGQWILHDKTWTDK